MAILLRETDEGLIAICAAMNERQEKDIYLDDRVHSALWEKFREDYIEMFKEEPK